MDRDYLAELGSNIRTIRKGKTLKVRDIERITGIDCRQIQRIESGKTNTTIMTLCKIAQALNVSIHDIIIIKDKKV